MAKTCKGKKTVSVKPHNRRKPGAKRRTVRVRGHCRSRPR